MKIKIWKKACYKQEKLSGSQILKDWIDKQSKQAFDLVQLHFNFTGACFFINMLSPSQSSTCPSSYDVSICFAHPIVVPSAVVRSYASIPDDNMNFSKNSCGENKIFEVASIVVNRYKMLCCSQ